MCKTVHGTGLYMSPEMFRKMINYDNKEELYTNATDVWSLCVSFYSLCTKEILPK